MNLKFGTGGLRAVMGEGPNCLNMETIREATLGVVNYIKKRSWEPRVAICYDSRINSLEFAKETARILAGKGCQVFIGEKEMPTPFLSYAIRSLYCDIGVCITASHNGREYNGYKVYGQDGCQITREAAEEIQKEIQKADNYEEGKFAEFDTYENWGKIHFIPDKVVDNFCDEILNCGFKREKNYDLKVVYTPLHGTGKLCVTKVLKKKGIKELFIVKEQEEPDGNFPTCPYPNPEEEEALKIGMKLCEKIQADILLATDPDSDRVGVAAKKGKRMKKLSGNQVGVLLADYILNQRKENGSLPENPILIKTIVTTEMIEKIAADFHAEVRNTLTGFKYIGEQIGELERNGEIERFLFGVEESCGYLIAPYVRDKDGIGATMLLCEMAGEYKKQGKTLWDRLEELYQKYGYFESSQTIRNLEEREAKIYMDNLREGLKMKGSFPEAEAKVHHYIDYLEDTEGLLKSNVLKIWLEDGSTFIVRPSGTEPKIKFYRENIRSAISL